MKTKVMCYRPGPNHAAREPEAMEAIGNLDGFLSRWDSMIVSERNSKVTDGEYDIIRAYQGASENSMFAPGVFEVVVFELPDLNL